MLLNCASCKPDKVTPPECSPIMRQTAMGVSVAWQPLCKKDAKTCAKFEGDTGREKVGCSMWHVVHRELRRKLLERSVNSMSVHPPLLPLQAASRKSERRAGTLIACRASKLPSSRHQGEISFKPKFRPLPRFVSSRRRLLANATRPLSSNG